MLQVLFEDDAPVPAPPATSADSGLPVQFLTTATVEATPGKLFADRTSLRCRLNIHHMVDFSTSDGGRWRHCSRCGTDWSGGGRSYGWTYDNARRGALGF